MKRLPVYLLVALCGLILVFAGVMSMAAFEYQTPGQLYPTVMAMLTQMPPDAVATQLARMGYVVPASVQSTAQAMFRQGLPPDAIIATLVAGVNTGSGAGGGGGGGSVPPPVVPTQAAPGVLGGGVQPPVAMTPGPGLLVPLPTTMPTAQQPPAVPTLITTVQVGNISGSVVYGGSGTITLTLTRPDLSTLSVPVGADGVFSFTGMTPGAYVLEASAPGCLTSRAEFTLTADRQLVLPPETLSLGDTNADNIIDLLDAALIASNFDGPAVVPQADLNGDGWIDVRDLSLVGAQFGLSGPTVWG